MFRCAESTVNSRRREMQPTRLAAVADLPSLVSNAIVATPPHRFVEGYALTVAGNGPKYGRAIAVLDEMAVSNGDQRTADSRTPVRLVHEDAVSSPIEGSTGIAARADFSASDDRARALGNPRPVWDRPGKSPPPAREQFRRYGSILSRQQSAE